MRSKKRAIRSRGGNAVSYTHLEFKENGRKFIAAAFEKTAIIKINVESMKGKSYQEGAWK